MDGIPVTLIVKATNQLQDQTIKCELSWTISRLKGYLSEVYECKPEEQKLIYSGQLLQDAVVLKDVLRQYEGQETHTVHLVYTPKAEPPRSATSSTATTTAPVTTSTMSRTDAVSPTDDSPVASSTRNATPSAGQDQQTSRDGIRRRNVPQSSSPSTAATLAAATSSASTGTSFQRTGANPSTLPYMWPIQTAATPPPPIDTAPYTLDPRASQQQQAAAYQQWIHQQYQQYCNQYMAYYAAAATASAATQYQHNHHSFPYPYSQQSPLLAGAGVAGPLQGAVAGDATAAHGLAAAPLNNNYPNQVLPADNAAAQGQQLQQQPRFPMLAQEPEGENRDWLDGVNIICRMLMLAAMIYFYSSPARCLLVVAIGLGLYLFSLRQQLRRIMFRPAVVQQPEAQPVVGAVAGGGGAAQDRNNNNVDLINQNDDNNNNNEERPLIGGDRQLDIVDGAAPAAAGTPALVETTNPVVAQVEENGNRASVLTFIRTFVGAFIASLVPEPPGH